MTHISEKYRYSRFLFLVKIKLLITELNCLSRCSNINRTKHLLIEFTCCTCIVSYLSAPIDQLCKTHVLNTRSAIILQWNLRTQLLKQNKWNQVLTIWKSVCGLSLWLYNTLLWKTWCLMLWLFINRRHCSGKCLVMVLRRNLFYFMTLCHFGPPSL